MPVNNTPRREFVFDGEKFSTIDEFYTEMERLLTKDLSWRTGRNPDAFNNLLRGGFGRHEYGEPIHIKWVNFSKSRANLGYRATVKYLENIVNSCHPLNVDLNLERLEEAKNGRGPTILDKILEIILNTNNSGHDCTLETCE